MSEPLTNQSTPPPATDAKTAPAAEPLIPAPKEDAPPVPLADAKTEKEAAAAAVAEYKFENVPEGYDTKGIVEFAKENGLKPETAQKLLERDFTIVENAVNNLKAEMEAHFKAEQVKWRESIVKDPKLGGDNLPATRSTILKAWEKVPADVQKDLHQMGYAEHPALVKILHAFGSLMGEDKLAGPSNSTPAPAGESKAMNMFRGITPV